jgi:recombination protein RecA
MTANTKKAQDLAAKFEKKYGHKAGSTGDAEWPLDVIPTGSLSLDYSLGTGGWPMGHLIEVFGPPDIGKSSVIGLNAIANAQAMGKFCAIVAVEPGFDPAWAERHGVNTSDLLVVRPNNGQEAFNMLAEIVSGGANFILFDSVGALLRESEAEVDGKPAQGGRSGLITWGVHNVLQPAWKNNVGIMFINQIRDKMNARMAGVVDSPGGHALKHSCSIRVQLKAAEFYREKLENKDEAEVGHRLKATILRNKFSEGSRRTAEFDYYKMDTLTRKVGIDKGADVVDVATRLGCIETAGAWYRHPLFPGEKNQLQGKSSVAEFVVENPKIQEALRKQVLEAMVKDSGPITNVKPSMEAIEDGS